MFEIKKFGNNAVDINEKTKLFTVYYLWQCINLSTLNIQDDNNKQNIYDAICNFKKEFKRQLDLIVNIKNVKINNYNELNNYIETIIQLLCETNISQDFIKNINDFKEYLNNIDANI